MKQLYYTLVIALFLGGYLQLNAQCPANGRYYSAIFPSSSVTVTTVPYGNAIEYNGQDTTLLVDIYHVSTDTVSSKPLMIFAFGGSFTAGLRQSPDLVQICNYFAERGYVCASIDYRLGVPNGNGNDTNMFAALMRGVQDMKAAVRYFYKDANTVNQFKIDTTQIFIGGVSAGGFIALDYAYMKLYVFSRPVPGFAVPIIDSLGGVDGNSGNPGYSQKIKGVIDLSGAIYDTAWIQRGDVMLVGEHGTFDSTVTCWWDSAYAANNIRSDFYGGGDIKNRMDHLGFNDTINLFVNAGHCPFIIPFNETLPAILNVPNYMDTTEWLIRDFIYKNLDCYEPTAITEPQNAPAAAIYPNPSTDAIAIYSNQSRDINMEVVTLLGQVLQRLVLPADGMLVLHKKDFSQGIYLIQFTDKVTGTPISTQKVVFD
jgi:hypothetical protein